MRDDRFLPYRAIVQIHSPCFQRRLEESDDLAAIFRDFFSRGAQSAGRMVCEVVARRTEVGKPLFTEDQVAGQIDERGSDAIGPDRVPYGLLPAGLVGLLLSHSEFLQARFCFRR